jgi:hypothetical protein
MSENTSDSSVDLETELEQLEPEKPMGIVQHLSLIGDKLVSISQKEKNPESKKEYYGFVSELLEENANEIQGMIEKLNSTELSEKVAAITREIDEKFAGASNYFLDAIEFYYDFIETENCEDIVQAKNSIAEGVKLLEEADAKAQGLTSIPEGRVEA